jgi:hypothetical protein
MTTLRLVAICAALLVAQISHVPSAHAGVGTHYGLGQQ